jgi:alpha-amylase/alpha-mannosidase (GH57 family)
LKKPTLNCLATTILFVLAITPGAVGQPKAVSEGIEFRYCGSANSVELVGDFNQWRRGSDSLQKLQDNCWFIVKKLSPSIYQYKYVVEIDTTCWVLDSSNPARVENHNGSSVNSVFIVKEDGSILLQGYTKRELAMNDDYPRTGKTLYLNIIWHQHQPLYLDPESDQLQGPWVRTHATKDYYDMAAMLENYPDIHFTVNLTSSLLLQLQEYYVNRLKPFVDPKKNTVDAKGYFSKMAGKTDPWIDLALKDTKDFNETDIGFLLKNVWNAFGVSEIAIGRFPQYKLLKDKYSKGGVDTLTDQDRREIKFWFYLANMDPDFLEHAVKLATGVTVDLTDLVTKRADGTYTVEKKITEEDCRRIVAETYKICSAIVPIHKKLMYRPTSGKGQIEIITTPFYHPILPLIYDSDLAKLCQPNDPMPSRFHYPVDAEAQVGKAVAFYRKTFGMKPTGMWPAEGSVAHDVVPVFAKNGIQWIATDEKILERSKPSNQSKYFVYAAYAEHDHKGGVALVVRDTELSDKIGFVYQNYFGEDAADDFVKGVLRYAPKDGEPDRLLTVILDGENAWEWYRLDNDGKSFQNALYRKLSKLFETKQVITTTVTEYLKGNSGRGIAAHPLEDLPKLDWVYPGSWINANYDTWIGEDEENRAWEYLLTARQDLGKSGLAQPDYKVGAPNIGTKAWYVYKAWESMYAAEGSDWFWWYGTDQTAPAGDKPFDLAYITHLRNIYKFAKNAGGKMPARDFRPIITVQQGSKVTQGAMAQSLENTVSVRFECDAVGIYVRKSIYIAGNHEFLGNWTPNRIKMHDDGSHGDEKAGDGIWSLELPFPVGAEIEFKFTNSGAEGSWQPGEEFGNVNRKILIKKEGIGKMIVRRRFGVL